MISLSEFAGLLHQRRDLEREGLWLRNLRLLRPVDRILTWPAGTVGVCSIAGQAGASTFAYEVELPLVLIGPDGVEHTIGVPYEAVGFADGSQPHAPMRAWADLDAPAIAALAQRVADFRTVILVYRGWDRAAFCPDQVGQAPQMTATTVGPQGACTLSWHDGSTTRQHTFRGLDLWLDDQGTGLCLYDDEVIVLCHEGLADLVARHQASPIPDTRDAAISPCGEGITPERAARCWLHWRHPDRILYEAVSSFRPLDLPEVNRHLWHPRRMAHQLPWICDTPAGRWTGILRCCGKPHARLVVHFHGNGEVPALAEEALWPMHRAAGCDALYLGYPGYGPTDRDETPLLGTLLGSLPQVLLATGCPPERIVLSGRSVGSLAVWSALAACPQVTAVILDSAIGDPRTWVVGLTDLTADENGLTRHAVDSALREHLDPAWSLAHSLAPVLALHTQGDAVTPVSPMRELLADRGCLVVWTAGTHNSILQLNHAAYAAAVTGFLATEGCLGGPLASPLVP